MNTENKNHSCSDKEKGACKCTESCRCGDKCTCGDRCQCATKK